MRSGAGSQENNIEACAFGREAMLELTHNWGSEDDPDFRYHNGNDEPNLSALHDDENPLLATVPDDDGEDEEDNEEEDDEYNRIR